MFVVYARLPEEANDVIPDNTLVEKISRHVDSKQGAQHALNAMHRVLGEYRAEHGDKAACDIWVQHNKNKYRVYKFREFIRYAFN